MDEYIIELLQKVEDGTIDQIEKGILEDWVKAGKLSEVDFDADKRNAVVQFLNENKEKDRPVKTKVISLKKWMVAAASVVVLLAVSSVIFNQTSDVEIYSENEVKEITLPDQSILTLNKNSKIVYDSDFGNGHRNIELSGSAYFDIERNEDLPFTITTKNTITKVLGTAFYLEEIDQDSMVRLDVDEGKVSIQIADQPPVIRTEGEFYSYNTITQMSSTKRMSVNAKFWKTKTLIFNEEKLETVLNEISNAYSVKLESQDDISNCRLTSTFQAEQLTDVLEILKITYQGQWDKKSDDTYRLLHPTCN